ncbi:MAG: hypothetical protein ACT4OG_07830 [Alphaproteobacteria bacterium]
MFLFIAASHVVGCTPLSFGTTDVVLTNQQIIEATHSPCDPNNELEVFERIFRVLPARVIVYPSENYYYFENICGGHALRGNIRLDVKDRDQGTIHFAYYVVGGDDIGNDEGQHYRVFTPSDKIILSKSRDRTYRMSFLKKNVIFVLYDLPQIPCQPLRASEHYLGSLMDESGIKFMLLFSYKQNDFKFMLCETTSANSPIHLARVNASVQIDMRTGFAFFRDELNRNRLIGVRARDAFDNTYYDGPFDQLPVNYVRDSALRRFIYQAYPAYQGQVTDYGEFKGRENEGVVISPYVIYVNTRELQKSAGCDARQGDETFFDCFKLAVEIGRGQK